MVTQVADPMPGALIAGRYRILGRLARGGMATVYQARDERLERAVAVKLIHPERVGDPASLARLGDEAKTVARLTHPNVVAVYDQGVHDGAPYVVMEFVRGRTLREVLNERRHLDPSESLAILEQILAALAVAHRAGLVHRDVKPENVLVSPPPNGSGDLIDAVVKVGDFGLARAVEVAGRAPGGRASGPLLATAEYVAPELVASGTADPRADVYSTGILLFEMLTGRVPFEGNQPATVARQHLDRDVPPPSRLAPGVPAVLDRIVARATRRDPAARPRDAAAMLAEVKAIRDDIGALAGPTRALAHPTVLVPSVAAPGSRRGDPRPSWARLPSSRRHLATARRRIGEIVPDGALRGSWFRLMRYLDRTRGTAEGRRRLVAALVVIGLVLIAGGWWLGFGRYTEAPSLTQLTKQDAIAEATRLGFTVEIGTGRYDEEIPVDTVLAQIPPPGDRIVRGGTVTVILSLGPERYVVPDVVGQAADIAAAQLTKEPHAFVVKEVDGYSDTLPAGFVVSTDPPAGAAVKPQSAIKMVVAKGPYPVHVPSVIGMQLGEADAQLRAAGFNVEVEYADDETRPRDQVIDQDPAGGTGMVKAKGTVKLVLAKGPPGPAMPGVVGMRCTDAVNQLRALGLNVNANGNDIERFFWHVKVQRPDPGTQLQQGQTVELECGL